MKSEPTVVSPSLPLVVIFNKRALAARALRRDGLQQELRERALHCEVIDTADRDETRARAEAAARAGHVVVAAGGDGTAHEVLNGVLAAERPDSVMGHIPLGTGNDLGRALGRVAGGLQQAVEALVELNAVPIDVGQVNGDEYFANGLGIGFDAEVTRRRSNRRIKLPGYFPAVVKTILSYQPRSYRMSWPEGEREGLSLMTAAMNGRCEGGGFTLAPNARLDDGQLDFYWIDPISFPQFTRYVWAVRRGTHERLPMVHHWRADRLTVETEGRLQYHMDGEYRELPAGAPLELVLHPKRLRMIV